MVNECPYIFHHQHSHHIQFLTTGSAGSVLGDHIQHIRFLTNGSVGSVTLTLAVTDNPLFHRALVPVGISLIYWL
jgi:hypothetical protein